MSDITIEDGGAIGRPEHWSRAVSTEIRTPSLIGLAATAVFLLGFGVWGGTAPIASAVVAQGVVSAAGKDVVVQHLKGGIVEEISVHEGDHVHKGQPLLRLDPTEAETDRDRLWKKVVALSARLARLEAVRDGRDKVVFDNSLRFAAAGQNVQDILDVQLREFAAQRKVYQQQVFILKQKAQSLNQQIEGLTAQQTAASKELSVVQGEMERQKGLLDKGLTSRSQYTTLLQSAARLIGQVGQAKSAILSTKTEVERAKEQLSQLDSKRIEDAVSQIDDLQSKLSDAHEQLQAASAVFSRVVVRAPCDGVIVKMSVNAVGSVVRSADPLVEILPTGRDLIVEAHVAPTDIDKVTVGREAMLRFNGLNTRTTPTVPAKVTYVSADRITDPQTQKAYYEARLRISDKMPRELATSVVLHPGMPVSAHIRSGSRTFLEYLVKPLTDSFHRAFKES